MAEKTLSDKIDEVLLHNHRNSIRHRMIYIKNLIMGSSKVLKKKSYNGEDLRELNSVVGQIAIACNNILNGRPLIRVPEHGARGWRKDVEKDIAFTFLAFQKAESAAEKEEELEEAKNAGKEK